MKALTTIAASILAVSLAACGGSEKDTSPDDPTPTETAPACAPAGAWTLAITYGAPVGSGCSYLHGTVKDTTGIATSGTAVAFTDEIGKGTGTLDSAACSASVTEITTQTIGSDSSGNPVTDTVTTQYALAFSGTSVTGTGTTTVTLSPNAAPVAGWPCYVPFTISGSNAL